ncbi:AAA family ATPase [archaeon]|jgi:CMP/dCMP kinase|nr:AAA family ATPase [archaeon]MBT6697480.1 AAA family ATPase [archaeon]
MVIITISGTAGSGKSTLAKSLIAKLNAKRVYAGGLFRNLARSIDMTVDEFLLFVDLQPEIDLQIDEMVSKLARKLSSKKQTVVVEGRAQFHFLPESLKIFVKVDSKVAANRIWEDLQTIEGKLNRNEKEYNDKKELEEQIVSIRKRNQKQYKKIYGVDYLKESNYDYVLDTKTLSREEALAKVLEFVESKS